jgi:hypothetical protein
VIDLLIGGILIERDGRNTRFLQAAIRGERAVTHDLARANKKRPYFRFLAFTLIAACAIFGI